MGYQSILKTKQLKTEYIFISKRLGFRNWKSTDLAAFAELNADEDVMEHFPKTLTEKETENLIQRFINHYDKNGHTYFATEIIDSGEFIGFIGLAFQEYETNFTPAIDIGWRLKKSAWGNGYATEGAKRCLDFAFNDLNVKEVIATCTEKNHPSENVMKKIGMMKKGAFNHPELKMFPEYEKCIYYRIKNPKHGN